MKKLLFILIILSLFIINGCYNSKVCVDNKELTKTIIEENTKGYYRGCTKSCEYWNPNKTFEGNYEVCEKYCNEIL